MERWQKSEAENPCNAPSNDHPHGSNLDYHTPLRSARGNASNSPSRFYKLSSELSRESLRIPGAIPFMWEQSPGRLKFPTSIARKPPFPKFSTTSIDTDPAKPSLATLFRQPSVQGHVMGSGVAQPLATPAVPQIAPPPATDRPQSSSARYSTLQRNTPTSSLPKNAVAFADAASDSASDVLSATTGGVSVDDSLMLSGPLRPSSTPSEARDFIMHRFLPAARTIACESPQTPSRRFLPLSNSAAPTPQTPSRCNGSFRDYGVAAACTESWLKTANSPTVCAAYSSMPTPRRRPFLEERFHGHNNDINHSSEEDEEDPPSTPTACGIFPFRIHISLHIRHSTKHANSSSKHHHPTKSQEHHKKSSKSTSSSQTPKRIIDVLQEDQSSTHEDESPVYHFQSRHFEAERERSRLADIKQTAIQYFSPRHLYSSDSYCRGSSQPHQDVAMQLSSSDLNHEECSDYGSNYDASSRFCSPSLAALHLVNGRTSQANMLNSTLVANLQGTRSSIGSIDNNPHPAILRSTEPHICESSICSYHMHISTSNKPHSYHPQLASPSCLSPQPSQMSSSHESTISKGSNTDRYWDAFPNVNQSEERTCMINNALYEHDEQETNNMSCAIYPSMSMSPNIAAYSSNGTRIEHGNEMQAGDAESQEHTNGNIHVKQSARSSSNSDSHIASNGDDNARDGDLHGTCHVGNGDGQHVCSTHKMSDVCDGVHYTCNSIHCVGNCGNLNACNGAPYMDNGVHCAGNGGIHAWHGGHYVCDQSVGDGAMHDVTHAGDWHEAKMGIYNMSRNVVSPPLPKSPTHSWLDRARPLVNSTSRSPNTSSRYKPTVPAAAGDGARKSEQASAAPLHDADSKWEALVKGSHFQPGHLRFSAEELFHQSRTITGAN